MPVIEKNILTLAQLLQKSNLAIPPFQRPYKWTANNVIQLIDDIERFRPETPRYRIGTVVIYQDGTELQIVDGQQRCLTFLLVLKAIMALRCDKLESAELKEYLKAIERSAFKPAFNSEVSQQNIRQNYREIERRVAGVSEAFIEYFLNGCEVTYFVIDDISEAFQFFDSQNARGRDLEPHDLLKAYHLRELNDSPVKTADTELVELISDWENAGTSALSELFADFMFRVRGWVNGRSSRYFTKKDVWMFKGVNIETGTPYPYVQLYKLTTEYLKSGQIQSFPFQLDQIIINGRYFFDMIRHYRLLSAKLAAGLSGLDEVAICILKILDEYPERERTGDKYVRMMFDCALLHYIDRFDTNGLSEAVKKIFIWAYSLRLNYQVLQLASVDNYVLREVNMFRKIKNAVRHDSITTMELPLVSKDFKCSNTAAIKKLFKELKYVGD